MQHVVACCFKTNQETALVNWHAAEVVQGHWEASE